MSEIPVDIDRKQAHRKAKREGVPVLRIEPWGAEIYLFKGVASYGERFERIFGHPSSMESYEEYEVGGFFGVDRASPAASVWVLVISEIAPEYPEEFIWHEALHATFMILDNYGVAFDVENHEVFNYTQAQIVSGVREKLYGLEGFR
ncbi:hypothetical protein [Halomonas sp. S2151]|uniref:hypothetical protein n=1 Tax=Halomonas sp. S2151 TaxID=579478 RepID=UPI000AF66EF0|nr:hypothetical protein [Halomonas sp. S2151]